MIPPGLAVFSVISCFDVDTAWPLWNVIVSILFAGQLFATVRLMRRPPWHPASIAVVVFTILLEPLHVGLANGQPTVPTISLLILALWWNTINWQWLAGIAFAIATALKPQLAAPFVILFIYQGKWKTVWVAAGLGIAMTAIGVLQMTLASPALAEQLDSRSKIRRAKRWHRRCPQPTTWAAAICCILRCWATC